ncbi:hypothetical protein HDV04_000252 [Boothiomyces sp. JEL0838]|nr:hypothetical protein HDV04_000252 [Boothiomyces sp. JEL0838]
MQKIGDTLVPRIGLGTYRLKGEAAQKIVYDAVKMGYRHIDTASVYKNEQDIGRAISKLIEEQVVRREELFVTSKIAPKDQGFEKAQSAIQASLENLGPAVGYIDLMLVHWPGSQGLKPDNPLNKENRIGTMKALHEAYKNGLIKAIGVSNFNIYHFEGIDVPIHLNQFEFHPLLWTGETRKLLEFCHSRNIVVGAYSCLGEGSLLNPEAYPELEKVSQELGCSIAQVLIAWALVKNTIVMPKASSSARLKENLDAGKITLNSQQIETIDKIVERVGSVKYCWDPSKIV